MASVEKNGQPSMEEILASIRRIVADDPSGVSPLIDLNRKPLDQNGPSLAGGVGADDSPDFELPSMFRPEGRHDKRSARPGQGSKRLGANLKSAPIGRLTDAIRNVGPKVAAVGTGGQTIKQTTNQSLQSQKRQTQTPQAFGGHAPEQMRTTQPATENGDATFGSRPKSAQSLSSLETKGEAPHSRGTNGMATSFSDEVGSAAPSATNGHAVAFKKANGVSDLDVDRRGAEDQGASADISTIAAQPESEPSAQATTRLQPQRDSSEPVVDADVQVKATPQNTPRVMAPFRDTRMNMMAPGGGGKPTEVAAPEVVSVKPTQQDGSDIGSIVPSALDLPGRGHQGATDAGADGSAKSAAQAASEYGDASGAAASTLPNDENTLGDTPNPGGLNPGISASEAEANPPPLPEGADTGAPQQIEDATADLLRPMLRQWLSDNMPRMVEKALHIEVAETVRPLKPTDGS